MDRILWKMEKPREGDPHLCHALWTAKEAHHERRQSLEAKITAYNISLQAIGMFSFIRKDAVFVICVGALPFGGLYGLITSLSKWISCIFILISPPPFWIFLIFSQILQRKFMLCYNTFRSWLQRPWLQQQRPWYSSSLVEQRDNFYLASQY